MKIRELNQDEFRQYQRLRAALLVAGTITPELCDERIEDGFNRRRSVGCEGEPEVNLNAVSEALGLRDTRDVSLLKNAVRSFLGWPAASPRKRVHLDESGAELAWVKSLREHLGLPADSSVQQNLLTALAALPGDPWVGILGSTTTTLSGSLAMLEALEKNLRHPPAELAQAKNHMRQCLKNLGSMQREGVPRVWAEAGGIHAR